MESTCSKTLKLQNFCKMLGERCTTGAPYDIIFQSSSKQFQSNTSQPNNNRNFCTSNHLHFKRSNSILLVNFSKFWNVLFFSNVIISKLGKTDPKYCSFTFSKYCSFISSGDVINPKLGQKGPKLVFHVCIVIER